MIMTLQERISKPTKVRCLLHNHNNGTPINPTDMVLAEDLIDMVVDDLIDERLKKDNIK